LLQAGIEFQNYFTTMLYDIMDAVNLSTASIYNMQHALNSATVTINQAAAAIQGLERGAGTTSARPSDTLPGTWQADNQRVFTGSGEERYQMETAELNQMLEQLGDTQDAIARQAFRDFTFPPEAFQNLNSLAARISIMRERVQQIEDNPLNFGTDTANMELERLRSQLSLALQQQNRLNEAVDSADVSAAGAAYLGLSRIIGNTERYVRDTADGQGELNQETEQGKASANGMLKAVKETVSQYATLDNLSAVMDLSDQMMAAAARLDMMNDGQQSTKDLQNMIFQAAERSGGSYQGTMAAVSDLGITAGGAFSGNEEIVAFMEQVNRQLAVSGTGESGSDAVLSQITQAMSSGTLGEGGFDAILSQAPGMIQAIASYMGLPAEQLRSLAAEGRITADIVKSAMFAAADETNTKFASMPMTFAQMQTSFQNHAQMAFQPVLERINELANSAEFQEFINGIISGFYMVSGVVLWIMDLMAAAGGFIGDNWSMISPIIYGVVAALGFYMLALLAINTIQAISKGIHFAMAIAEMMLAAATGSLTAATAANIAAQNGLNASMLASPVLWIIILIIALIAIIFAVCNAIAKTTGIANSGFSLITGGLNVVIQFFKNLFLAAKNVAMGIGAAMTALGHNIHAAFHNSIKSAQALFYTLMATAAMVIARIAEELNKLPFIDFDYSGVVSAGKEYLDKARDAENSKMSYESIEDAFDQGKGAEEAFPEGWMDDAFDNGAQWGDDVKDQLSGLLDGFSGNDGLPGQDAPPFGGGLGEGLGEGFGGGLGEGPGGGLGEGLGGGFGGGPGGDTGGGFGGGLGGCPGDSVADALNSSGTTGNLDAISANTGDMAESMNITQEDLKYLRDIAEQETVNRFTTAQINIDQSGMKNTVTGTNDLEGFVSGLTEAVNEAVISIAEGVHS